MTLAYDREPRSNVVPLRRSLSTKTFLKSARRVGSLSLFVPCARGHGDMDCYFRKRRARTDRLQGHRAARVEKATHVLLGAAGFSGALDIVLNHVNDDTLRLVCCVSQLWRQAVQDDPTHRERARSVAAAVAAMRSRAGP